MLKESPLVIVNGLAIGEETKGNTVQWLVRELKAHTVWRSGGWQGGHHIVHDDNREFCFNHFGAGTFEGAETYLNNMVISPADLFAEAMKLEKLGVTNPLDLIAVDQNCLITTPFHSGISRLREILRGANKKGTIGKGVGEALKDSADSELAVRAGEFANPATVLRKVGNTQKLKLRQAKELLSSYPETIPPQAYEELDVLQNNKLVELTTDACRYLSGLVRITDDEYLDRLMTRQGTIINEVSHGVLLHPWYGFAPNVTQVDSTSQDVIETIKSRRFTGQLLRLGVVRSYFTRHGAGPLVSYNADFSNSLTETHNDAANDWLGPFRNGHFDIVALQYALKASGSYLPHNGLVLSFMDMLSERIEWQVCEAYEFRGQADDLDNFFCLDGNKIVGIKVHPDTRDQAHYQHQLRLTELLKNCHPLLRTLTAGSGKSLEQVFIEYIENKLDLPVVGTAYGPKVKDRHFRPSWEQVICSG